VAVRCTPGKACRKGPLPRAAVVGEGLRAGGIGAASSVRELLCDAIVSGERKWHAGEDKVVGAN